MASKFQQGRHKGLVRLQLDGGDSDVPMRAVKLEVEKPSEAFSKSGTHSEAS
jgi:hypothetical protein